MLKRGLRNLKDRTVIFNDATLGGRGVILCCLFFVSMVGTIFSAEVIVEPVVGDSYLKLFIADFQGHSVDSTSLFTFLDSSGYRAVDTVRHGDTLVVSPNSRSHLAQIIFNLSTSNSSFVDTIPINKEYSASLVHRVIHTQIQKYASKGYPFASFSPTVTNQESIIKVVVFGDLGPYVQSSSIELISEKEVRPWLITRSLSFDTAGVYNYGDIQRSEQALQRQTYVESAQFLPPEIVGEGDTVDAILPLLYTPRKNLLFDGALGYQSEGEYHITGRVKFSLNNIIGFGEEFGFSYVGEGYWQRAHLYLTIPYFAKTAFSVGIDGTIELTADEGGYGDVSFRIGYDIFDFWQVGFGGRYYEVSDTSSRKQYGGITLDMVRLAGGFERRELNYETKLILASGLTGGEHQTLYQGTIDFSFIGHIPFGPFAYLGELRGGLMLAPKEVTIDNLEKFRLGGYATIRGYGEELYPSLGFAYNRSALRWYFDETSALYLFTDNGVKVYERYSWNDAYWMMGYGVGIVLPVRKMKVHLEWARHRQESEGLGRLHFSLSN